MNPIKAIPQRLFTKQPSRLSLRDIHQQIKSISRQAAEETQIALAEAVTTLALRTYWQRLLRNHEASFPFPAPEIGHTGPLITEQIRKLAEWLGEALSGLPLLDAAYNIGSIYTAQLPARYRNLNGIFYTPPPLANRLLDQAEEAGIDWRTCRVLDPACGGGAFLAPAAVRMIKALAGVEPAIVIRNVSSRLCGWEKEPFAAWLTRFFVEAACLPVSSRAGRGVEPVVTIHDSLQADLPDQGYDLVIGNPPFGRIGLSEELRRRYQRGLYGHANLYGLFTDLAVRLAVPGGLVSFLTPASFLSGEYFKNLRALLRTEVIPLRIDFVENRKDVFEGVLQETVLATYRKAGGKCRATAGLIRISPQAEAVVEAAGDFHLPEQPTAPWIMPRHAGDMGLIRRMRTLPDRLEDWGYKVSTGPLVWNRHKDQLRDQSGTNHIPLIWAESVTADGRFLFRSEKRNHQPYFMPRSGKDDWLLIHRPCVLLQRTTAKEQHRRLIAAAMPADFLQEHGVVTIENHLNMLLPITPDPLVPPDLLAAFLNSEAADRAFRCQSGSVAVSAYELESLPLPSADEINSLRLPGKSESSRSRFEQACSHLYGLKG